jgi:hypothetical protein
MVRVPVEKRQAEIGGLPSRGMGQLPTSAPTEAFGGGQALNAASRGMNQAAGEIGGVHERLEARANESALEGIDLELSQAQTRIEIEAKKLRGKDAASAIDYADQEWQKVSEGVRKRAANPAQQAAAAKLLNARFASLNRTTQFHAAQELDNFDKAQGETYLKSIGDEAISNRDDPSRVSEALAMQEFAVERQGKKNGLDAAMIKFQQREVGSATRLAIVDSILDSQDPLRDTKAKAFFEKNQNSFTEKDKAKASQLLKSATMAGESQRTSDSLFAKYKDSREGAFAEAAQIKDPGLRDETVKRLSNLYSMQEIVKKDQEERQYKQAANVIDKTGDPDKIPRTIWNNLTVGERSALESYAKHKREGTQPVTNWGSYYNLKTMAASPPLRSQFMRINLMQYRNEMADSEFKDLVNAQDGLRKGDEKTAKMLDGVRTDQEIVNTALRKAGIDPEKDSHAEQYGLFRSKVDEKVIAWKQAHQKTEIPGPELQKIVDDMMIEGVTQKRWFWFDKKKRKFELEPGEKFQYEIDQVPAAERSKIEAALKRRGIKATEEKILELYSRKAGQ